MLLISICAALTLSILFYAALTKRKVPCDSMGLDGHWKWTVNKAAFFGAMMVLVLTSTLRYGFIDTYAYKEMYLLSRNDLDYVYSAPYDVEAGWLYFCYLLNYISSSPKIMLFVSALIINLAYFLLIKKYSCDPAFSALIFFCLMYMDTNNGLRQMVASAIIILAFPLLTKKKLHCYLLYALIVLLMRQFHESVIVCLLIPLAVVGKPLNNRMKAALLVCAVFLISPGLVNTYLGDVFADSKYLKYLDANNGMGAMRAFIVGVLPAAFALLYITHRPKINIGWEEGILLNLLLINSVFVLMGLDMQYWARIAFYTQFAPIVLMPKLVYQTFAWNQRSFIKIVAILCYLIFFAYNIYVNIAYGAMDQFYIDWSF